MTDRTIELLLVEDNMGDAHLLRGLLAGVKEFQCHVVHVDRISDVSKRGLETPFDVALLDLSLPDSSGLDTVARGARVLQAVPIIVLTGTGDEELAIRAVQAGAQDYLVKGQVTSESLSRSLRYAIERKHADLVEQERKGLQQALHGMDQVLGIVAHDLRIPLTSLQTITGMLTRNEITDPGRVQQYLKAIHNEVLRMNDMVTNLLEAARIESGAAKWNWSNVRAGKVIQDAIDVVRPLVSDSRIRLEGAAIPDDLAFRGDGDAIRRMLVNLLANAVKCTREGSIKMRANADERDGRRWMRWTVCDTGDGMSEETLGRLGEAFALNRGTVGPTGLGGTGLGLAICKGVAAVHGGAITVSSAEGEGSTFTAVLRADLDGPASSTTTALIERAAA